MQKEINKKLGEEFATERKLQFDCGEIPILWAKNAQDAIDLARKFQENYKIDFLSDITAYDNMDGVDGPKRLVVVYQYYSTENKIRIRVKLALNDGDPAISLVPLWEAANWLEREVWDLYGVSFEGHPNLRRIMMDERFKGYPMRKDYPLKGTQPFPDSMRLNLGPNPLKKEEKP
jgi:NADH-quinone oxidoreductase subunit C